jgi:transcription elongation factor Elf1
VSELNLKYNPDPICPYCGGVMINAWEIDFGPCLDGSAIAACGHCGAEFSVERNVDVTYSTAKIPRGINCGPAGREVKDGSLS